MTRASSLGKASTTPSRRPVLHVILGAPQPVWILVIGVFLNRAGSYFATFLTLFLEQTGFTLRQMPIILLLVGLVTPFGSMLGGWAADRFSRKTSLVGTTVLAASGLAIIGVAPTKETALVGVIVAALFAQSYLPAASALLLDHTEEVDRVPIFAFFRLSLNLGAAIGPVLAIALVPYGLHLLFLASCACSVVFATVMLFGLPNSRKRCTEDVPTAAEEFTERHFPIHLVVFFAAVLVITLVYVQYSSSVSLAVAETHGASTYATLLTLNAVLVILFELPLSSWTRRLAWRIPMFLGTALMAIGIAINGAFHSYWMIISGVLVWTIGEILFSPVVASAIASLSSSDRVGLYQGYLTTVQAMGFAVGPAIGIFVYGFNAPALWFGCLIAGGLASVGFAFSGRHRITKPCGRGLRVTTGRENNEKGTDERDPESAA